MSLYSFVTNVDVANNFAFLPRNGLTFCNCYAKVVLAHEGILIPNFKANDLYDFFHAGTNGWTQWRPFVDYASVACAKADPHGHIAVAVDITNDIWTSAGAKNYNFCTLRKAFGSLTPTIFYHAK